MTESINNRDELMTYQEAMKYLKVTRRTIYNYIDSGLLTPVSLKATKDGGRPIRRLRKSNLDSLIMESGKGTSESE